MCAQPAEKSTQLQRVGTHHLDVLVRFQGISLNYRSRTLEGYSSAGHAWCRGVACPVHYVVQVQMVVQSLKKLGIGTCPGHCPAAKHPTPRGEGDDPTQHAKGRTLDCPGRRKETTTRRNVTQGGQKPKQSLCT